ncbi:uncharacterized protein LOC124632772 [Helicoverpa zea]|uniref:uncharacterized protein LOC124632093 n=1 Tax=Helicoverpa zea TaxID=7113 RepID=UPI001F59863F|nr:uncharacterized protein LOC124632093 [Helicoverpa zea]XP_047022735.1 uncharacterized protein LOC124632111 [Helicoverpa zea]XP_047023689.1 uncharacterized protein LOC124632772 [Helicoverpa zea]
MGKRKHERSDEDIMRKIRKLKNTLRERKVTFESDDDLNFPTRQQEDISVEVSPRDIHVGSAYVEDDIEILDMPSLSPTHVSNLQSTPPEPPPSQPEPEQPPLENLTSTTVPGSSLDTQPEMIEETELEEDILLLLGDAPKTETPRGPAIHKDIASRWQLILANGLAKDSKDNICRDHNAPSNCDLLLTPLLNPEVKAALPEALVKRDAILQNKQKQLGVALSALATLTDMIISNELSRQKLLKPLSDASRILCDSHYQETRTRRNFIITSINHKLKNTLTEATRDSMLFGENLTEKLKAAKTIQQSGDALKSQKPKIPAHPNAATIRNKGYLNYQAQHRKVEHKPQAGPKRPPWPAQRPQSSGTSSSRQRRPSPTRTTSPRRKTQPRK